MTDTGTSRKPQAGLGRRTVALVLLLPLLVLQTLEAASLFCDGLAHANLLSAGCPHHAVGASERGASGADGRGVAEHPDPRSGGHGEHDEGCTCPRTGNSLPDDLIQFVLGGVGVPVSASDVLEASREAELRLSHPDALHPPVLTHLHDHPPRG